MKYIFHEPTAYCRWRKSLLIMRLTLILVMACVLQAGAKNTATGQTVTLSVSNAPLEKVCKEIERQSGYYFVYAKDLNKTSQLVSVSLERVGVQEALRQVFKGLPFSYQVIDKVVVVNTVNVNAAAVQAGTRGPDDGVLAKVEGLVLSETRAPLEGATVVVKATGKTTLTNNRGLFSFSNLPVNSVLVISFIGYTPKQVVAKEASPIEVVLAPSENALDQAVIKGYYTTSNRLNTGNVAVVKGEDIQKQPVSDPLLALEGRVPGLYISQTSGMPGAYSSIRLRGQNSIMDASSKLVTANDPLYIIDGVPFSSKSLTSDDIGGGAVGRPINGPAYVGAGLSPFNNLNPSDIERVEVLKDADATAIYGSRGANGVILIFTKRGKAGMTKYDVNVFTGGGKIAHGLKLLNTQQYLEMRREALQKDGKTKPGAFDFDINGVYDTTRYTDWQKVLIGGTANFTNAQFNVSGGNGNTQFIVGGGYGNQATVFPGNYYDKKYSARFNVSHQSMDQKIHIIAGADYVIDDNQLPSTDMTNSIALAPNAPALYDKFGNINWQIQPNGFPAWANPLAYTQQKATAISRNLIGNLGFDFVVFPGLVVKSTLGYTHAQMDQNVITLSTYYIPASQNPSNRENDLANSSMDSWIIEPQAIYKKAIYNGILDVLVGSTFQQSKSQSTSMYASGFSSDALIYNIKAASSIIFGAYEYALYKYSAIYGRIGYTWRDRYVLNLTARRDGSSRFGPGKQFGNFGAIGTAWIFSNENFFKDKQPLSFGKLRMSYGSAGNDGIQDYGFLSTYSPQSGSYQGITTLVPSHLTNPFFAWETVKKFEIGLELAFFRDRVQISSSFYRNRTDNQLTNYPLPSITGFGNIQENLPAVIQNTGFEFSFSSINIRTKVFSWNTSFNISIPRNKLVAFPNLDNSSLAGFYFIGHSLFTTKVYHFTGVNPETGLYTFASKRNNTYPNPPEDYVLKEKAEFSFGGFRNTFTYKRLSFDIFFQFVKQSSFNYLSNFSPPGSFSFLSNSTNQPNYVLQRWQHPGQNAPIQKFSTIDPANTLFRNYVPNSDLALQDGSFVRIKNISLSYQLEDRWLRKIQLQNARFYVQCQNLFTITKYMGGDPETGGALPPLKMITAGLQVSL